MNATQHIQYVVFYIISLVDHPGSRLHHFCWLNMKILEIHFFE